jgi:hypothetical protein
VLRGVDLEAIRSILVLRPGRVPFSPSWPRWSAYTHRKARLRFGGVLASATGVMESGGHNLVIDIISRVSAVGCHH